MSADDGRTDVHMLSVLTRIIVLGGGVAGLTATRELERALAKGCPSRRDAIHRLRPRALTAAA